MAPGDAPPERSALTDEVLLAHELRERAWSHPRGERLALGRWLEEGFGTGAGLRPGGRHRWQSTRVKTGTAPAAVTYIGLPISSGGAHSLGRMSRRVAYQRTLEFLRTCTEPIGSIDYQFSLHDALSGKRAFELHWKVKRRFGNDLRVPEARVPEVLDFLDEIDPQPVDQWGMAPVWFWASCRFLVLDPSTRLPLPGQDPKRFDKMEYEWQVPLGTSSMRLILRDHAQFGIELCIPDADDEVLRRVVPWLQAYLPFKFSPKQWRVWTPTKAGSLKVRKMAAPETDRAVSRSGLLDDET